MAKKAKGVWNKSLTDIYNYRMEVMPKGVHSGIYLLLWGNDCYYPEKILLEGRYISVKEKDNDIQVSYKDIDSENVYSFWIIDTINELVESEEALMKEISEFRTLTRYDSSITHEKIINKQKAFEKKQREYTLQSYFFNQLYEYYQAYREEGLIKFFDEGKEITMINYDGDLKSAGKIVKNLYLEDTKQELRQYKDLKDASNIFFDKHNFTKYKNLSRNKFYENVKKA